MDLQAKIRTIPLEPGVYLYKNAEGDVIYVGKAKNLRSRVASYFHEARWEDAKTGTLVREAVDVDYIVVAMQATIFAFALQIRSPVIWGALALSAFWLMIGALAWRRGRSLRSLCDWRQSRSAPVLITVLAVLLSAQLLAAAIS